MNDELMHTKGLERTKIAKIRWGLSQLRAVKLEWAKKEIAELH